MSTPPNFLRLWPDNPTALDLLGFEDIAAPVLEAIARERLDPVAVGVFGDWGSGKTTVLEILNEQLKNQPDTLVVFTRPWEYDPTLDARATLITEVLEVVRAKAEEDKGFWEKSKDKFEKLAERIKWSKAIALASKSAITFTLPSPDKVVEIFGEAGKVADPTLQGFRKEFSELMGEFTNVKRVVVLVDDLDRCLPPTVVMTLEAIKLFLSVKKMAFVIATDEALVKAAITKHFDPSQQGARMAADYLEREAEVIGDVALGDPGFLVVLVVSHGVTGKPSVAANRSPQENRTRWPQSAAPHGGLAGGDALAPGQRPAVAHRGRLDLVAEGDDLVTGHSSDRACACLAAPIGSASVQTVRRGSPCHKARAPRSMVRSTHARVHFWGTGAPRRSRPAAHHYLQAPALDAESPGQSDQGRSDAADQRVTFALP